MTDPSTSPAPQHVTLPWPPASLSPNARVHWATLARSKRAYRMVCATQARQQGVRPMYGAAALHLGVTYYPPSKRAYDLDNAIARTKAGFDGLADVLLVDDSKWSFTFRRADQVGGFVKVEVTPAGGEVQAWPA